MLRAVPAMLCMAISRLLAFRSGIFCLAISSNCALVICPTFSRLGFLGALGHLGHLLEQHRRGRRLGHKGEGTVGKNGDQHRNDGAFLARSLGVVALAEFHDIDPMLAQGRTDGRRGVGLPRRNLQLDLGA